ncbi:MAG TPA: tyrosine-type recombinase/integrase [Thermoanaerobaculia bacterium]|nr:tyrosine-type recombinase/integrase [Thermoanaerobaculia bacterium]
MNVQQAIDRFLEDGHTRNLSERTLRAYQSDLTQFQHHVSDAAATEITHDVLEKYLEMLGTGAYRDTSIRRKVAALKVFFRYLEEDGVVTASPAKMLKIKQPVENRMPVVLSNREIKALLAAPKKLIERLASRQNDSAGGRNRFFCAVRDNLIIELLLTTGMRIGELVALDVSDVERESSQLRITGRSMRGRSVSITSAPIIELLNNYLEMRSERKPDTTALFIGRSGTRLTIYSIENIFKKHVRVAEIKRHVTPHSLRHTMAANLVNSGTDIRAVQEMLGHASILSTQVYTKLPPLRARRKVESRDVPVVVLAEASSDMSPEQTVPVDRLSIRRK